MYIIRIENEKDGLGIFHSRNKSDKVFGNLYKFKSLTNRHHKLFPPPQYDKCIQRYPNSDEFCAFKSTKQMEEHITKHEIKKLIKSGFIILLIKINKNKCEIGEYQILFKKKDIISCTNITELYI